MTTGSTQKYTVRKFTAGVTSLLLAIGIGVGVPYIPATIPEAQAATPVPGLANAGFDPQWTLVPEVEAHWLQSLSEDSYYWTSGHSSGDPGDKKGDSISMLGETYDISADGSSFKTRVAMEFVQTKDTTFEPFTSSPYLQFSTLAMGRQGGMITNPDAPLSLYFWAWDGGEHFNTGSGDFSLKCTATGRSSSDVTTVVRVTYGEPGVWGGCMPTPAGSWNAPGGEMDQLTGQIYVQDNFDSLDNYTGTYKNAANGNVRFTIWDPVTGRYSVSGAVQPADWVSGQVSKERQLVSAVFSDKCVTGYESNCSYNYAKTSSDFALDAEGSVYMYTSQEMNRSTTSYVAANAALVRIKPSTDAQGNYTDGTPAAPWKYNVVKKMTKADPSLAVTNGDDIWGASVHDGKLFSGGSVSAVGTVNGRSFPSNWGTSGLLASRNETASRVIVIDPLTGVISLGGPLEVADNQPLTEISNGKSSSYVMAQDSGVWYFDQGSTEMFTVIEGQVFNDTLGDGSVTGDPGLAGATVAVYRSDGTLIGSQFTAQDGSYSLVISGYGDYFVRVVQPAINDVNAVQTYGAVAAGANEATITCTNGTITTGESGPCWGALATPYFDPPLGEQGTVSSPATWAVQARVTMTTNSAVATVDFGVSARGSYGDAKAGPVTGSTQPAHVNVPAESVWLGARPGAYDGPAGDNTSHNATDDGVFVETTDFGLQPLNGATLGARSYNLVANVNGPATNNAIVRGWSTGNGTDVWQPTTWAPTIANGVAQGPFTFGNGATIGATPAQIQFRANVSTRAQTAATNSGDYYADTSGPWTTPGEIEDYAVTVAGAVYRPVVHTPTGYGVFTVSDQTNAATAVPSYSGDPGTPTLGKALPVTTGVTRTVTVTAPGTMWALDSAQLTDFVTGAVLHDLTWSHVSATVWTVNWTPQVGEDAVLAFEFAESADAAQSLIVADRTNVPVTNSIQATVLVNDVTGKPLAGQTVQFSAVAGVTLSADECVTGDGKNGTTYGACTIEATSVTAKVYTNALSAKVLSVGTWQNVGNSPLTLTFTAGSALPGESALVVTPDGPLAPAGTYTATVTAKDGNGNVVANQTVYFAAKLANGAPLPSGARLSAAYCVTTATGACAVTLTSTTAGDYLVSAQIAGVSYALTDVGGSPAPVTFTAGPVAVTKATIAISPSTVTAGEPAVATVTVVDAYGNRIPGQAVDVVLPSNLSCTTMVDQGDGTYTCTLTGVIAGTYPVGLRVGGTAGGVTN
ncbi:MAG: Ig-like domain-containing protein, partial [Propionibacteriaceae bacterium]|nr:Ig-like domain-containing protein [Propionibacteriaceae bacterium]